MYFEKIRKSSTWCKLIILMRNYGFIPPKNFEKHFHFSGWFNANIAENKITMENHNTQIETSIFWEKRPFEATSLIAFSANACDFENILDVGANTGIYTLVAGSANKNANIIAIEPIVSIFNLLEKMLKKINLMQHV